MHDPLPVSQPQSLALLQGAQSETADGAQNVPPWGNGTHAALGPQSALLAQGGTHRWPVIDQAHARPSHAASLAHEQPTPPGHAVE